MKLPEAPGTQDSRCSDSHLSNFNFDTSGNQTGASIRSVLIPSRSNPSRFPPRGVPRSMFGPPVATKMAPMQWHRFRTSSRVCRLYFQPYRSKPVWRPQHGWPTCQRNRSMSQSSRRKSGDRKALRTVRTTDIKIGACDGFSLSAFYTLYFGPVLLMGDV